jgi:hypothetical protein
MRQKKTAQGSRSCSARHVQFLRDLTEPGRWWALERRGKNRGVRRTAQIHVGHRRQQAERGDHPNKQKDGQNCQPSSHATGIAVWNQQQSKSRNDCNCRNQSPSAPMPALSHRLTPCDRKYISLDYRLPCRELLKELRSIRSPRQFRRGLSVSIGSPIRR